VSWPPSSPRAGRHDASPDGTTDVGVPVAGRRGPGPKYGLVFVDRLLVTLVHLRIGLTHQALGVVYGVGSSTIDRAIGEIRPLLAERGFAVPEVLASDVCRTRERRAPPVASASAVHRTPRDLRRNPPGRRRAGL
jgi:hypothetical protein